MKKLETGLGIALCIILIILILEASLSFAGAIYLRLKNIPEPVKQEAKGLSILCLGDSFTQGFGAPQGKSYPEQLRDIINEKSNKNIHVYKEFRINSSTVLKHIESDIDKYSPAMIIVMTGCNDTWSLENTDFHISKELDFLKKTDIILSKSKIYKLIKISFLNIRGAIVKNDLKFPKVDDENYEGHFNNKKAEMYYNSGNSYMFEGKYETALTEFKNAESLEPENPWVHWRLACVYSQSFSRYDLAREEAMLAVKYGDSSIIGHVIMIIRNKNISGQDDRKFYAALKELELIVDNNYKPEDKDKAKRYLKQLYLYNKNDNEIKKIISCNLNEILRITQRNRIKLILMRYPMYLPGEDAIKSFSDKYNIPLVDNYAIFKDMLNRVKREDLFVLDGHCNAEGYRLIAENLYNTLIKKKMIDDLIR